MINKVKTTSEGEQEENNGRKRLGEKPNTFTSGELVRIEKAMENNEDIRTVAKEMGRSYNSVKGKITYIRKSARLKKGKFSKAEIERVKQAVANNEDYKSVAAELNRMHKSVHNRMLTMKGNPGTQRRSYTFEEDICILEKVITRLKAQKLSSGGFLPKLVLLELSKELQRHIDSLRHCWEGSLQTWLLQHYTGTSGLRIERMLTRLLAQKYNDHRGIDWSDIVKQHKEFAGQTSTSISQIYNSIQRFAKSGKGDVSLQEVADYAAKVYQPGKESAAKVLHRERIILYFKERIAELGINVVV